MGVLNVRGLALRIALRRAAEFGASPAAEKTRGKRAAFNSSVTGMKKQKNTEGGAEHPHGKKFRGPVADAVPAPERSVRDAPEIDDDEDPDDNHRNDQESAERGHQQINYAALRVSRIELMDAQQSEKETEPEKRRAIFFNRRGSRRSRFGRSRQKIHHTAFRAETRIIRKFKSALCTKSHKPVPLI